MVLPTDIKKANQSKSDGEKIETASPKHRGYKRGADSGRKAAPQTKVKREKSQKSSTSDKSNKDSGSTRSTTVSRPGCKPPSKSVDGSQKSFKCGAGPEGKPAEDRNSKFLHPKCYFDLPKPKRNCTKVTNWQRCQYVRDECGSGIVPKQYELKTGTTRWCGTPLSMYQATIGELGRQLLCGETVITRDIHGGPPCNIDEYCMPACGGYYRRYDCLKPCEALHVKIKNGKKVYRDRVERYWNPCVGGTHDKVKIDVNDFAPHNAVLAEKFRRSNIDGDDNIPCW